MTGSRDSLRVTFDTAAELYEATGLVEGDRARGRVVLALGEVVGLLEQATPAEPRSGCVGRGE